MPPHRLALIATVALLAVTPAYAAGGGGGGGFSASPSGSADAYDPAVDYAAGVTALKAGDFKKADGFFRKVLARTPKDSNTLILSGVAKSALGDPKNAAKMFDKALKIEPRSLIARRENAIALFKIGETEKAKAELAVLAARDSECAGTCALDSQIKAAIAAVNTAMAPATAAPTDAMPAKPIAALTAPGSLLFADAKAGDGAYLRAVALINEARYPDALVALDAALQVFGPHPDVLTYIGYTYRKMGQFDRAESYYNAALAIAPTHRGATEYYGELKAERGDLAGARVMLARLDAQCSFGCIEAEDLRRWIAARAS